MQVTVTTGLAGNGFAYSAGDNVEKAEFSRNVGEGWRALCAPSLIDETAVKPRAPEFAVKPRGKGGRK